MSFICSTLVSNLSNVRYLLTFVVLMVALVCHCVNAEECVSVAGSSCHCRTNVTEYEIDLRPLTKLFGTPILKGIPGGGTTNYTYSYDPCTPFNDGNDCQNVSVCQNDIGVQVHYAIAVHKGVEFLNFQHEQGKPTLTLKYAKDNPLCDDSHPEKGNRIAIVNLECWTDKLDRNVIVTESPTCTYTFTLRSQFACINKNGPPQSKQSLSLGSILLIVFFIGLFLYFVVGLLIQRYVREKRGVEQIPNLTFWVAIPGLVKDGFVFVFTSVGICRRDAYYQSI